MVTKGPLGTESVPHKHGHNDGPSQVTTRPPAPAPMGRCATFVSRFRVGSRVHADGDASISMVVTGHLFKGTHSTLECSWFSSGGQQQAWIEEWRLEAVS